jgi:hypothetical protein
MPKPGEKVMIRWPHSGEEELVEVVQTFKDGRLKVRLSDGRVVTQAKSKKEVRDEDSPGD